MNEGLAGYDRAVLPVFMGGNVFLKGAKSSKHESKPLVLANTDLALKLVEKSDGMYLQITIDKVTTQQQCPLVTTELLGKAKTPGLSYEQPDGSSYRLDTDYLGMKRNERNPSPGPFAAPAGRRQIKVWPIPL